VKRLLVTGYRFFGDIGPVRAFLVQHGPGIVVHGGSPDPIYRHSADWLAHLVAEDLGWPEDVWPVPWRCSNPEAAYRARNRAVVAAGADVCGVFPGVHGFWHHCWKRAEEAGIPCVVYDPVSGASAPRPRRLVVFGQPDVERVRAFLVQHGPGIVVHDSDAAEVAAAALGFPEERVRARWEGLRYEATRLRNLQMLELGADALAVFPEAVGDVAGTQTDNRTALRRARRRRIPVTVYR
jgi:hypothetical protein